MFKRNSISDEVHDNKNCEETEADCSGYFAKSPDDRGTSTGVPYQFRNQGYGHEKEPEFEEAATQTLVARYFPEHQGARGRSPRAPWWKGLSNVMAQKPKCFLSVTLTSLSHLRPIHTGDVT